MRSNIRPPALLVVCWMTIMDNDDNDDPAVCVVWRLRAPSAAAAAFLFFSFPSFNFLFFSSFPFPSARPRLY
jgi:hypothetical protein